MTKMRGLGNDPLGRFAKDHIYDVPAHAVQDHIDQGYGRVEAPGENPDVNEKYAAERVIRGDQLVGAEAKIAEGFQGYGDDPTEGKDPHELVHEGPPSERPDTRPTSGETALEAEIQKEHGGKIVESQHTTDPDEVKSGSKK